MDETRALTNKIFKQKINEYLGADVVELPAVNDDRLLDCEVFEAGMNALKASKDANKLICYAEADSSLQLLGVFYTPDYDETTPIVQFEDLYNALEEGKEVIIYCKANLTALTLDLEGSEEYIAKFTLRPSIYFKSKNFPLNRSSGQISFTSAYSVNTQHGVKEWLLELYCEHAWEEAGDYYRTIWNLTFESLY